MATRHQPRPRTLRRATAREARRVGTLAERRGRQVPPTIDGFHAAATRSHDAVAEALISRSNQRLQRIDTLSIQLQCVVMPVISGLMPLDLAVRELGGNPSRAAFDTGKDWVEHLAWGLDSIVQAVRLLLCLQPVGAAVIARTQLERWSANLAGNLGMTQEPGEDTIVWLDRLWSQPAVTVAAASAPVRSAGQLFAELSEMIHGRGRLMALVWLDSADVSDPLDSAHVLSIETVCDALTVSLSQIRAGLATLAAGKSWDVLAQTIAAVTLIRRAEGWVPDIKAHLLPMLPFVFAQSGVEAPTGASATGFHRAIAAMRTGRAVEEPTQIWPALAFGERRYRAAMTARRSFAAERVRFGAEFDSGGIESTHVESVLASEMAAMLGVWLRTDPTRQPAADAFVVCSSALRSAVWLWLEDDNRAMGCLRPVIDQLARVRTWRLKPAAAAKLESCSKTTPRDWLEAAGWRRLNLVSRAFGEYVHGSGDVNRSAALAALISLQDDPADPLSKLTGRTHALTALIHYVQAESALWIREFDPDVATAYWRVIRQTEARAEQGLERLLDRAWTNRSMPVR